MILNYKIIYIKLGLFNYIFIHVFIIVLFFFIVTIPNKIIHIKKLIINYFYYLE